MFVTYRGAVVKLPFVLFILIPHLNPPPSVSLPPPLNRPPPLRTLAQITPKTASIYQLTPRTTLNPRSNPEPKATFYQFPPRTFLYFQFLFQTSDCVFINLKVISYFVSA